MSKFDRIRGMETCYKIDSLRIQDIINTCAMSRKRLSLLCEIKGHIDETVYLLQKLFKEKDMSIYNIKGTKMPKDVQEDEQMTLDEAIEHCRDRENCSKCGQEHKQLREWLE